MLIQISGGAEKKRTGDEGIGSRFLGKAGLAAAALVAGVCRPADEWQTTSSLIGTSKYGSDFERYDYVNPDAPEGRHAEYGIASGTFDSFNPFIVRGTAGCRPATSAAACSTTR